MTPTPTAAVTADDYRVVVDHDDEGELVNLAALTPAARALGLADLARLRDPSARARRRWARLLLADEGPARAPNPRLRLDPLEFVIPTAAPLVFGDTSLRLGVVVDVERLAPGAMPNTTGPALVGHVVFLRSVLAGVAWAALRAGVLDGVCLVINAFEIVNDRGARGVVREVRLGTRATACLAAARVLDTWEE
ncbi:MAG: hypothetical protein ACREM3_23640 [Candidatus Rokuibacteriota bacterium]